MVFLIVDSENIVKICKKHGALKKEETYFRKNKFSCKKCGVEYRRKWILRNKAKQRSIEKNYYHRNKKLVNFRNGLYRKTKKGKLISKRQMENLTNSYVKNLLKMGGFKEEIITNELIELKRASVTLSRLIKENKKND